MVCETELSRISARSLTGKVSARRVVEAGLTLALAPQTPASAAPSIACRFADPLAIAGRVPVIGLSADGVGRGGLSAISLSPAGVERVVSICPSAVEVWRIPGAGLSPVGVGRVVSVSTDGASVGGLSTVVNLAVCGTLLVVGAELEFVASGVGRAAGEAGRSANGVVLVAGGVGRSTDGVGRVAGGTGRSANGIDCVAEGAGRPAGGVVLVAGGVGRSADGVERVVGADLAAGGVGRVADGRSDCVSD